MERLLGLRFFPLRFDFETLGPFRAPEFKGALFRGGFGHFFRDLVCSTRAPNCLACAHLSTCPYSLVFETPVQADRFPVLRKYPNAPHPFVLVPPLDPRPLLPAGEQMAVSVVLIGPGIDYLPHFVCVFEEMGRSGRYGGAFRLSAVRSEDCGVQASGLQSAIRSPQSEIPGLVYDGASHRFLAAPVPWTGAPEHGCTAGIPIRRIRLEFATPLRMRTNGHYNASPDFVAVTHALLRRIHLLTALYAGADSDDAWLRPLLAAADAAVTEQSSFRLFAWDRMSGRQQRRVQMDGVLGSLVASGDLTALAPYFQAGEWLNVGSGTSMGMGRYCMECGS